MKRALIIMAKDPLPGQTKTRLSPPLSADQAAELYRVLLLDTLTLACAIDDVHCVIAYTPAEAEPYFRGIGAEGFELLPQAGDTLGRRLDYVLSTSLRRGFQQAVALNSDGPSLPAECLRLAFATLDDPDVDVALGPSEDGGYYLIGLKHPCAALFDVEMSTPTVLQETLARASEEGLRSRCLPAWYDVDTVEDLRRLIAELPHRASDVAPRTRRFIADLHIDWGRV